MPWNMLFKRLKALIIHYNTVYVDEEIILVTPVTFGPGGFLI